MGNIDDGLSSLEKAIEIDKRFRDFSKQDKEYDKIRDEIRFRDMVFG